MLKVQYVSVFLINENLSGFNQLKDYLYNSSIIKHMFNAIKFLSRNIWNENLLSFSLYLFELQNWGEISIYTDSNHCVEIIVTYGLIIN